MYRGSKPNPPPFFPPFLLPASARLRRLLTRPPLAKKKESILAILNPVLATLA